VNKEVQVIQVMMKMTMIVFQYQKLNLKSMNLPEK
jgi:hypothetical protein